MRSLIRIGLFFIGLLVAPPVFSAIVAAPDLSVVQREKEIQVIFSWEKPVDFTEETVAERYRLSFPVQISETSVSLSQIRAALPLKWRRMRLIKEKERLDLSIVLPEGGFVEARKEENRIFVSLRDGKPSVKNDSEKKSEEKTGKGKVFDGAMVHYENLNNGVYNFYQVLDSNNNECNLQYNFNEFLYINCFK